MKNEKKRRKIEVVPYDMIWKERFELESKLIKDIMGDSIISIHHIGSTSIPNMSAKPIIDILVAVSDIKSVDRYNDELVKLGYTPMGEYGISMRRFFLKGLIDRTHHIHIFEYGDDQIRRHLNFRDYLRLHQDDAKRYEELKIRLSSEFKYDIDGYSLGKNQLIAEIDNKAKARFCNVQEDL